MATNKMFITVIEKTLEEFTKLEENSNLPKKFSIKAITDEMNKIAKSLKDGKEKKKGTGKKSVYNIYVKEQMAILKEERPELSNSDRMSEIGARWQTFKEENPNYNELYEDKLKEVNGSSDDDDKNSDDVVAKKNTKETKKKTTKKKVDIEDEKKTDSSDDEKADSSDDEKAGAKTTKKKKK